MEHKSGLFIQFLQGKMNSNWLLSRVFDYTNTSSPVFNLKCSGGMLVAILFSFDVTVQVSCVWFYCTMLAWPYCDQNYYSLDLSGASRLNAFIVNISGFDIMAGTSHIRETKDMGLIWRHLQPPDNWIFWNPLRKLFLLETITILTQTQPISHKLLPSFRLKILI